MCSFFRDEEKRTMSRLVIEGNTVRVIDRPEVEEPKTIRLKSKGKDGRKLIRFYRAAENGHLIMDVQVDHRKIAPIIEEMSQRAKDRVCTMLFLLSVLMLVLSSCHYLSLTNAISMHDKTISRKEQQLAQLHLVNENLQHEINAALDLNSLYQVATEELGMVPAGENDVITYRARSSGYIRQYDNVPVQKKSTPVVQALHFLHLD